MVVVVAVLGKREFNGSISRRGKPVNLFVYFQRLQVRKCRPAVVEGGGGSVCNVSHAEAEFHFKGLAYIFAGNLVLVVAGVLNEHKATHPAVVNILVVAEARRLVGCVYRKGGRAVLVVDVNNFYRCRGRAAHIRSLNPERNNHSFVIAERKGSCGNGGGISRAACGMQNKHIVSACISGQLVKAVVARKRVVQLFGIIEAAYPVNTVRSENARKVLGGIDSALDVFGKIVIFGVAFVNAGCNRVVFNRFPVKRAHSVPLAFRFLRGQLYCCVVLSEGQRLIISFNARSVFGSKVDKIAEVAGVPEIFGRAYAAAVISDVGICRKNFVVRVACQRAIGLVCFYCRCISIVAALVFACFVAIVVKRLLVKRAELFNGNVIKECVPRALFAVRALS